jgi:hypothetical protein
MTHSETKTDMLENNIQDGIQCPRFLGRNLLTSRPDSLSDAPH